MSAIMSPMATKKIAYVGPLAGVEVPSVGYTFMRDVEVEVDEKIADSLLAQSIFEEVAQQKLPLNTKKEKNK